MTGLDRFRKPPTASPNALNETNKNFGDASLGAQDAANQLAKLTAPTRPAFQNANPPAEANNATAVAPDILGGIRSKLGDSSPVSAPSSFVPASAQAGGQSSSGMAVDRSEKNLDFSAAIAEEDARKAQLAERRALMGNYANPDSENNAANVQNLSAPSGEGLGNKAPQEEPAKKGLLSKLFGGKDKNTANEPPQPKSVAEMMGGAPPGAPGAPTGMPKMKDPETDWIVAPSYDNKDDPLLGCLMLLCKMLNRATSREALVAELPVGTGIMTPEVFIRSAEREEISAKLVRRKLSTISSLVLPCVVLLEAKRAAIMTEIKHGKSVELVFPDSGDGASQLDWKTFEKSYTGYAIFARPRFRFDKRTADHELIPKAKGWFWSTVFNLWPLYSEVMVASFLINIMMIISPLFMSNVIDRVVPHLAFETLWVLAIGAMIAMVFQLILLQIRTYMTELAGKAIHTRLSARLFQQVMGLKMSERGDSTGAMTEKLNGLGAVHNFFTAQTALTMIDFPFCLLFLVMTFVLAGPIALVPASIMLFLLILSLVYTPIQRKFAQKEQKEKQHGRAVMVEAIYGMETVKSTGAEGRLQNDWELINEAQSTTRMKNSHANSLVMNIMGCAMQVNGVLIAVFGVYLIKDGSLTIGGLMAANMMSSRALGPMMRIAGIAMRFHSSVTSLRQIDEIMKKEVERPIGSQFIHRDKFQGSLEFKNVSFAYPDFGDPEKRQPGQPPKDSTNKALDNISFKIDAGEKVGIIGRIGSGKSTLERLILGLYHVKEGSIMIDGIDIRQIDPAELRRNVGTVPQDVFLFYGTIRENIVVHAPYADDDMVLRAAHIAGVDEFASRHPQGLDMQVGEKGQNLSGGQRQTVSVARAFLIDPPIVLLDEPTSAMDTTSENRFKARLQNLMGNRTLIMVTHRYSLLSIVDRLIVMDNGKIVADGPKERVLEALKNGTIRSVEI